LSKLRFFYLKRPKLIGPNRLQNKALSEKDAELSELRRQLEFTERQYTALEKKCSGLESVNSVVENELRSETEERLAQMEKFQTERSELEAK
jgi:hypothetical protein